MDVKDIEVLIGDGDLAVVALLKRWLRTMGFSNIRSASDGYALLLAVKRNPVDLLLLSWDLPKLDGLGVVREIHKIPRFTGPKIVLMTSEASRSLVSEAAELGIGGFLVRPFTDRTLHEQLQKALGISLD